VRLPRLSLRTLMIVVAILAILLADLRPSYSWVNFKPILYLLLIPLVSSTLAMRNPHRSVIVVATAVNALLLLAWYELRRPLEGILIGGEYPEFVREVLFPRYASTPYHQAAFALDWLSSRGTMVDLLCLAGSLLILIMMLARPISFRARICAALCLTLLALYGWGNSKRWGGTSDSFEWLTCHPWSFGDKTPIHLAQHWFLEGDTLSTLWRAIGVVRALELLVLAIVLAYLTAVGLHAILIHETKASDPTYV
jgi:hypothetical protein